MKDEVKTKKQLIEELKASRRRIAKTENVIEKLKQAEEALKQKEGLFKLMPIDLAHNEFIVFYQLRISY